MKVVEKAKATATLAKFGNEIDKGPVIVTTNGKPIAALVAIENADLETVSLSLNPEFLAIIERSRARHRKEGGISTEEMRRRLSLKENHKPTKRSRSGGPATKKHRSRS
jgi:antitoxin (DNA-binding transcriptional repressor) of toxin-antitoxin stability system